MIENERELHAALGQIAYWKAVGSTGEQSWLAGEQALGEILKLHQQVAEYQRRSASHRATLP